MIALYFYAFIAVLLVSVAALLVRQDRTEADADLEGERKSGRCLLDNGGLGLEERIFDPADYRWLRDELGYPSLARSLARHRKEMALRWLWYLRNSFNELVRTPPQPESTGAPDGSLSSWAMLVLTLRFHILLAYATLIVRLFGPYHRLIPPFGWLRVNPPAAFGKERCGAANAGRSS